MGRITVLDNKIAELIAAGEVVERPLSVVKELVENSVDAGAAHVTVEIRGGGIEYIRVTDDGAGIAADDLPLAFLRHATSKIQKADDLYSINSLGFRGEALASIAAVSRLEVFTSQAGAGAGARILLEGGDILETDKTGAAPGTTFVMRDLFYNTPARMKFLKKASSEASAIGSLLDRLALCWPHVSLRYIRDGKEQLFTPGNGALIGALYAVYGREMVQTLLPADYSLEGVGVNGYISMPLYPRGSRKSQHFFLNSRLINSPLLAAALEEGYKNSVMTGKFPVCALHITLHPSLVDVNVHPAKSQVKFADDRRIFSAVYWAVQNAQSGDSGRAKPSTPARHRAAAPDKSASGGVQMPLKAKPPAENAKAADIPAKQGQKPMDWTVLPNTQKERTDTLASPVFGGFAYAGADKNPPPDADAAFSAEDRAKNDIPAPEEENAGAAAGYNPEAYPVKLIGEVFDTYYIAQQGDEMLLVDKHAAHERLLFEELKRTRRSDAQVLLSPLTFRLDKDEVSSLLDNADALSAYGFMLEEFGPGTLMVREIPAFLSGADIPAVMGEIASALGLSKDIISTEREEEMLHRMACGAAVKAGTPGSPAEQKALIEKLLENPDIKYCPHGRPIIASFSRQWLHKQFRRIT